MRNHPPPWSRGWSRGLWGTTGFKHCGEDSICISEAPGLERLGGWWCESGVGAEAAACSWEKPLLQVLGVRQGSQRERGWLPARKTSGGWLGLVPQFPHQYNEGLGQVVLGKVPEGPVGLGAGGIT